MSTSAAADKGPALRIRVRGEESYVQGLNEVVVRDERHAQELLQVAHAARAVAKTDANEASSRSHCVVTLRVGAASTSTSGSEAKAEAEAGKGSSLHLVDLAGSERLAHSGSDRHPATLREQCAINSSLVALKNVLRALAAKQAHVPFRDSKLTHFLQPSLASESAKTLMLATVSQEARYVDESCNTLRFAQSALKE